MGWNGSKTQNRGQTQQPKRASSSSAKNKNKKGHLISDSASIRVSVRSIGNRESGGIGEKVSDKMGGTTKKVVDVAFKASRNIDWDGMAKLIVSDEARKEFATLRRAFDEVNHTLQTKFSQVSLYPSRLCKFSFLDLPHYSLIFV